MEFELLEVAVVAILLEAATPHEVPLVEATLAYRFIAQKPGLPIGGGLQ